MGNYPPPPYPPPGPPYGGDWKYQRDILKQQARAQRNAVRAQRDMAKAQREAYRYQLRGLRRSSILGPILLITLGILFLLVQTGRLESHRLWDWYGRFWPFLLVAAGVVMLLEWGFDQYVQSDPDQPRYRRRLGGGVFTLLLILTITGVVFSQARMHVNGDKWFYGWNFNQDNIDEFLGDKHESDQSLSQQFPAGTSLSVDNPRGDVTVSGTSDDNQIHIAVHKEIYTRSDSEADSKFQHLNPTLNSSGGAVSLSVPALDGGRADLIITLPTASTTTVMANHGDVRVNSIKAAVFVTANHGDINLSAISGPITTHINNGESSFSAHSITGPISISGHGRDTTLSDLSGPAVIDGDFFGTAHFEHIRGPIKFHTSHIDLQLARLDGELEVDSNADLTASEAIGPLTITTGNRNISLDRISGDVSVTNRNGSVDLTSAPPLGNVTIQNRNGSVEVTVPEHSNFIVQADTKNGDVDNDFSLASSGDDSNKSFSGTVGKGGSTLHITTSQGDINLKKASVMPLAPLPPIPPIAPLAPMGLRGEDGSSVVINKNGVRVYSSPDGSSVIVGKDGARIYSGANGDSVIVNKDGARITSNADGSNSSIAKDGTRVSSGADGSTVYVAKDGTRFVSGADGGKSYRGSDGTRITVSPDGTKVGIGPDNKVLSEAEIDRRLNQVEADARNAAKQIRNSHQ